MRNKTKKLKSFIQGDVAYNRFVTMMYPRSGYFLVEGPNFEQPVMKLIYFVTTTFWYILVDSLVLYHFLLIGFLMLEK